MEIWIRANLGVAPHQVHILHSDLRRLLAAVRAADVAFDLAALHAPSAVNGAEDAIWWATTQQLLAMSVDPNRLLLGIDANAKVGATASSSVGVEGGSDDDPNGAAFRLMCDALQLFIPQTVAEGGGGWTWQSPGGTRHRLDYIAIPHGVALLSQGGSC